MKWILLLMCNSQSMAGLWNGCLQQTLNMGMHLKLKYGKALFPLEGRHLG